MTNFERTLELIETLSPLEKVRLVEQVITTLARDLNVPVISRDRKIQLSAVKTMW
jgi:hypothetical protein